MDIKSKTQKSFGRFKSCIEARSELFISGSAEEIHNALKTQLIQYLEVIMRFWFSLIIRYCFFVNIPFCIEFQLYKECIWFKRECYIKEEMQL